MKRKLLTAAALTALAVTSYAQTSVGVYGLIDSGIAYSNNANTKKDGVVRLSSGAMNTSRIGLRGSEDLGGGLKAVFRLEGGFKADTGAFDRPGRLFGRQANLGLEGGFGRIVAGRSTSTTYDFILPFDLMGYSAQYSWATAGNASGGRKDGMLSNVANIIKYQGTFGGVKLGATYGFGEVAGNAGDNARYALGIAYAADPFSVAATYDRANGAGYPAVGNAYDKAASMHLAGLYRLSEDWKLNLGYRHYKKTLATNAADLRSDLFWGGASYRVTPALTLIAQIYSQNIKNVASGKDADPIMYSLRAKYALSKRTGLYASASYAKARNNQLVGVSRDEAGFGSSQTGLSGGIQHRF